jgi:uncharacterized membrane protein
MKQRSSVKVSGRRATVAVLVVAVTLGGSAGSASAADTHAPWKVFLGAADPGLTTRRVTSRRVAFDASASTVKYGTVARYKWKFGDGTTLTTTTPKITHTYARGGTYTAVLTAESSAGTSTVKVFTGAMMLRNGGPTAKVTRTFTLP